MKVVKAEIESIIPNRAPFIMIDNLMEATEDTFVTDFEVLRGNIFLDGDVLREYALIENIAQSSAAGISFMSRSSGTPLKDGYMGGISKLIVYDLPRVHDKICTVVRLQQQLGNMYLLKGENYLNGIKLMECEIKLAGLIPASPDSTHKEF